MRRHATMGLAFVMPLAVSVLAFAQPRVTAPKKGADAGATSAAGKDTAKGTSAADAGSAGGPSTTTSATGPSSTMTTTGGGGGDGGANAASSGPSSYSSTTVAGSQDGATYAVRLRDLESRVDELKDQIRRSHTRLSLLSDTIMSGGAAGSRAEVLFDNEMSNAFRLIRALIVMDGTVQYNRTDETGALADQKEIPIFTGSIPPGDHSLQVLLNYQGNGYGVFTYLRGYKFEVKSSHSFTVAEGKTISVTAIGVEKGGVTTPLEQRPSIDWREKVQAISGNTAAPVAAAAGGTTVTPSTARSPSAPSTSSTPKSVGGSVNFGGGTK